MQVFVLGSDFTVPLPLHSHDFKMITIYMWCTNNQVLRAWIYEASLVSIFLTDTLQYSILSGSL